jgi:ABC-type multidrug transport system fused ATPase/permease subunit
LYYNFRATTFFLTSTNTGRTTNRFSQDLQLIDSDLPQALDSAVISFFGVIISAVLVFTGSGYVAAAIPACIFIVMFVQVFYLRTSRQLRLLDIETKAPLFSQFIETLGGLTCIRAYGWSSEYMERSYAVLDTSQKPYYLLWCIQRWLTLVLDLLAGAIAVMLVAFATSFHNGSTGLLGVALFNVINFSGVLQTFVTEWTQLETALGAISRIKAFVQDTALEDVDEEVDDLPANWPSTGSLVFKNVSASYETSAKPVLDGLNLIIRPGEKVALCGRTGR